MAVEGVWAPAAPSLLPGKLKNDDSSLLSASSPDPSCPLYLSSPFFHQTARNETYSQGFSFFLFLSVLLKALLLWTVWVGVWACAGERKNHMYILCEIITIYTLLPLPPFHWAPFQWTCWNHCVSFRSNLITEKFSRKNYLLIVGSGRSGVEMHQGICLWPVLSDIQPRLLAVSEWS